ncbi:PAS-domain containing protein [Tropicimonas aquimaris]|uniref:PAS-domain containing protein n=1 Tax=Tropicimonas aquimaris TaxID=914152 RepID=A0ABW3IWH0_9RHOB
MQTFDLSLGLVLAISSMGTALLALVAMGTFLPSRRVSWAPMEQMGDRVVFLFEDTQLVDATADARAMLETGPTFLEDWPRTVAVLSARFPDFAAEVGDLAERQRIELSDPVSGNRVEAEWRSGLARIVFREGHDSLPETGPVPDRFSQAAIAEELATLRGVIDDAPMLVWKEDATGAVRWANAAYVNLVRRVSETPDTVGWPLPRLFTQRPVGPDMAEPPRRLSITVPDESAPLWFDSYDEAQEEDTLVFALPADKLVRAEGSLREFVQTLTKTFAHLPTGLAIFDKERRLALFNPAMTDLSALEPSFLSAQPTLFEFLDQLREHRRMPEPKNYRSWRKDITELESAAASGTFQETWSLPSGQTYSVTGRPHPNGAIAFLFEDISAEISATRRFRAELDLGRAVLDTLDDAIAVFNASGALVYCNRSYRELWQHDPESKLGETAVTDATGIWQIRCRPTPVWGDLRDFVHQDGERAEWTAEVQLVDGRFLGCRFSPLSGHATLAAFATKVSAAPHRTPTKVWPKVPARIS